MPGKTGLYVEISEHIVKELSRMSISLGLPKNRIVEIALLDLIDKDPQLKLLPKNDSSKRR